MRLIISLILVITFILIFHKKLMSNPVPFYIGSIILSIFLAMTNFTFSNNFLNKYILSIFQRGAIGTAFFIVVMYAVCLNNKKYKKIFMGVRGEISIIGSIFVLCHNIFYGKTYFILLFTNPQNMQLSHLISAIISLIMIVIMIPLFITSFKFVRKKIKPIKWKKIQTTAYIFYALIYVHVVLLMFRLASSGKIDYLINIIVYSIIFGLYGFLRIKRARIFPKNISIILQVFIIVISFSISIATIINFSKNIIEDASYSNEVNKQYIDGTYKGSGIGYNGKIISEVTIKEGKITSINISHKDDPEYYNIAKAVIDEIIEKQSVHVDAISGATMSSDGIITATRRALKQATAKE